MKRSRLFFLGFVDLFTVTHLILLRYFSNRGAFTHDQRTPLMEQRSLTDPMIIDLNSRVLLLDPRPYVARIRDSDQSLTVQDWTLTQLGKEFLSFIQLPEPLR